MGLVNAKLSEAVAADGYMFAPDPSSGSACTIGGNVAFNSGGAHCLKYGMTSNHVLGLKAVLATGEVVNFGSPSREQIGPDWTGLFVGNEGLFGIALEVTLQLLPRAETFHTVLAGYRTLEQAGEQAALADRIRALKDIAAIEADRLAKEQQRFNIAGIGIDFAKKQGELEMANGNASLAIEAQKLEIINEYAKKRAEIENLLRKDNLAPDEQALLRGVLGGLAGQQKQTLDQLGWGKEHFSGGLSPFEAMGHNTGIAGTARDQDPAFQVKAAVEKQTPLIQSIVDIATRWFTSQQVAGQLKPANFN